MPKNKEGYVLKQLKKLLDLIEEVYEGEESFLLPPDYLEVRGMLDNISKNHSADIGALSAMNSIYRRNRLMKKMKIEHKIFFTFDEALEKICKDAEMHKGWDGAWQTFISYTDKRGYTDKDIEDYLESISIFNDGTDPDAEDDVEEDVEDDYDMPF